MFLPGSMDLYQKTRRFFAACAADLEEPLAEELVEAGARDPRPTRRGVHFLADEPSLYRVVLGSALASRVLAPLSAFDCHSDRYLRRRVSELPWEELFDVEATFAVSATLANSRLRHTQYAAQVVKDGLCDRFRSRIGRRPDVDRRAPDLRLHLHVQGNKATLSLDCADGAMHRRGYRAEAGEAPMQETVAAAVVRLSGWTGQRPLLDPFCGSGTLLAEAVFRATGVGVGTLRMRHGVRRLPTFDEGLWRRIHDELATGRISLPDRLVRGCDVDGEMIRIAATNLERVPGGESVVLRRVDFREHPGLEDGVLLCNPPYGVRMGDPARAASLMKDLGDFLKQRCKGSTAWIYLGHRELAKSIGLRPALRRPLRSGGLDGRLLRYDLY